MLKVNEKICCPDGREGIISRYIHKTNRWRILLPNGEVVKYTQEELFPPKCDTEKKDEINLSNHSNVNKETPTALLALLLRNPHNDRSVLAAQDLLRHPRALVNLPNREYLLERLEDRKMLKLKCQKKAFRRLKEWSNQRKNMGRPLKPVELLAIRNLGRELDPKPHLTSSYRRMPTWADAIVTTRYLPTLEAIFILVWNLPDAVVNLLLDWTIDCLKGDCKEGMESGRAEGSSRIWQMKGNFRDWNLEGSSSDWRPPVPFENSECRTRCYCQHKVGPRRPRRRCTGRVIGYFPLTR